MATQLDTEVGTAAVSTTANGSESRPGSDDRPVRLRSWRSSDAVELAGAALSSFALAWLLFGRLTPLDGAVGFVVVWLAGFLLTYWLVIRDCHGPVVARDRLATVLVLGGAGTLFGLILTVIAYVVTKGLKGFRLNFFTETLEFAGPLDPLSVGGGLHAIVGTLQQVGFATLLCVPLAITTAVYLNEVGGRGARVVRILVDAMFGIPSVVAGLFIYATWILGLGNEFSGFAATLALSILMLPIVTRTAEEMLRLVPGGLREAALALGAPEWRVTMRVVIPTARTGLVTATLLGAGRVVGETAPVLLTAFGSPTLNTNLFEGPQQTLSLMAYQLIRSFQGGDVLRAWTAAMTLLVVVLILFVSARAIVGRDPTRERKRRLRRFGAAALARGSRRSPARRPSHA